METAVEATRPRSAVQQPSLLRIGGMAGIGGGVLGIVANILHPRLAPSDQGDLTKTLDMISGYSLWLIDHFAILVTAVLALIALVAVARSIVNTAAEPWARIAFSLALAAGGVAIVSFSYDGSVMSLIGKEWANTQGAARAEVLQRAQLIQYFDNTLFAVTVFGLFGVTQTLFGLAIRNSGLYPGWIGPAAIAGGIIGLVSGTWMWMVGGLNIGNFLVLFTITSVVFTIWLIGASWRMLRMSEPASELVA
jgi:hypothetical protein